MPLALQISEPLNGGAGGAFARSDASCDACRAVRRPAWNWPQTAAVAWPVRLGFSALNHSKSASSLLPSGFGGGLLALHGSGDEISNLPAPEQEKPRA